MKQKTTFYRIPTDNTDLRIAVLADLHNHDPRWVIEILRQEQPDCILVPGDLFESPPRNPFAFRNGILMLRQAAQIAPTFYCRGNHDYTHSEEISRELASSGAVLLHNRFVPFGSAVIGGLSSGYYQPGRAPHTDFLPAFCATGGYRILLCHHPEYYPLYLEHLPIDLIVSGHAHGGQIALLGHGLYAPGQGILPRYCGGLYHGRLLVSRGLSNTVPIPRIGNPCEVVIADLFRQK